MAGPEFVPPKRLRGVEKSMIRQVFDRALPNSINLGLGEPDLPTPEVIKRAAIRVITEEQNGYTSHAGLPQLRELVASDYPELGINADQVIITAGSQEALYLALLTLVDEGDEVLLPDPGFVAYPAIVRMAGGVPVYYRLPAAKSFGFDREAFRRALSPRTKVVVCISPSNPTGRCLSDSELEMMVEELKSSSSPYMVSDEIYRELYYTSERPASISSFYPRTIVLSGLSKSMSMTGWRLGWMCGEAAVIQRALVLHGYVTTCASSVSQKAAMASWSEEAETAREKMRETFKKRRDHLLRLLDQELNVRAVTPDGAFYTMADVSRYGSSTAIAMTMMEERVITVPGAAFGSEGEGFLRISFCADKAGLTEGVKRIGAALARLGV